MALEDITGRTLPAIDVFSLSIRALKEHLIEALVKQGTGLKVDEIQWVLTVPAIWSDPAKQFMRVSAEKVLYVTCIDKCYINRNQKLVIVLLNDRFKDKHTVSPFQ
jgi:hypothetical protein